MHPKCTAQVALKYRPQAASGFSIFGGARPAETMRLRPGLYNKGFRFFFAEGSSLLRTRRSLSIPSKKIRKIPKFFRPSSMQNIFPKTAKYSLKMHRTVIVSPVFARKPANLRVIPCIISIIIEKQENNDFFEHFLKVTRKFSDE